MCEKDSVCRCVRKRDDRECERERVNNISRPSDCPVCSVILCLIKKYIYMFDNTGYMLSSIILCESLHPLELTD